MRWPDWFGRRARDEAEEWKKTSKHWEKMYYQTREDQEPIRDANLRLIAYLREMDQWTYNLYQCAPDWGRMRPIVASMYEATEKRMEIESNRIKHLMVGEIREAYNEPKRLIGKHQGTPVYEVPKIEDKNK